MFKFQVPKYNNFTHYNTFEKVPNSFNLHSEKNIVCKPDIS
jgi:hypothetical protein